MKYYLTIEKEDEVLLEITAPTFEILSEKVGAWERAEHDRKEREHVCGDKCKTYTSEDGQMVVETHPGMYD